MLYINLTNSSSMKSSSRKFGVSSNINTISEKISANEDMFVPCHLLFNKEDRVISVLEGDSDEDISSKVFLGDEELEKGIIGQSRNPEEDILMFVNKIRFIEGVKALFRIIPVNGGALVCLYAGAAMFYVHDEWIPFARMENGVGISKDANTVEYTIDGLMQYIKVSDEETGLEVANDGSSLVTVLIASSQKGSSSLSVKNAKSSFVIMDDKRIEAEKEAKKVKEEERAKHKAELQEFQADYNKRMEENEKNKKAASAKRRGVSSSARKGKKETTYVEGSAAAFLQLAKERGYVR